MTRTIFVSHATSKSNKFSQHPLSCLKINIEFNEKREKMYKEQNILDFKINSVPWFLPSFTFSFFIPYSLVLNRDVKEKANDKTHLQLLSA